MSSDATLDPMSPEPAAQPGAPAGMSRSAKRTLALLALVCTLPVLASYFMFYVWKPQDRVNYGELVTPVLLPELTLSAPEGMPPLKRDNLIGQWTLVYVGTGECAEACQSALYAMRQSRMAQAREFERVSRLWLITDAAVPGESVLAAHTDLQVAYAANDWLAAMPDAHLGVHFYLVDPLGHVMMRFPEQADIKGVIKDIKRLLKYSALGR